VDTVKGAGRGHQNCRKPLPKRKKNVLSSCRKKSRRIKGKAEEEKNSTDFRESYRKKRKNQFPLVVIKRGAC